MLALLGWNPGTEQEIFSMDELIEAFSLERVSKSGARFNPEKTRWFNAQYLHAKTDEEVAGLLLPLLRKKGVEADLAKTTRIVALLKERATFVSDLWDLSSFLFIAPQEYDAKGTAKFWKGENPARIAALREVLAGIGDFTKENAERIVHDWIVAREYPMGQVMNSFRLTLVGASSGPSIFDICEIIGKEETLRRIDTALEKLGR